MTFTPKEIDVLLKVAEKEEPRQCEHEGCLDDVVDDDYCEEHLSYYFCECGNRLEDAAGSPGDGLCRGCD